MLINRLSNIKTFKCKDDVAKMLYDKMNILPINVYYSTALSSNLNVFILTKRLSKFLKDNHIEVNYGE